MVFLYFYIFYVVMLLCLSNVLILGLCFWNFLNSFIGFLLFFFFKMFFRKVLFVVGLKMFFFLNLENVLVESILVYL